MRNGQRTAFAALALALVLAGGAYWYFGDAPQLDKTDVGEKARATPVEAAPVIIGPVARRVTAIGSLRSDESVVIRPEIAGRIARIHFNEGEAVAAGAPLISFDDSVPRAQVAEAEAGLSLSTANYERAKELVARRAGTQRALDEALARLNQDRARVDLARAVLRKYALHAPFSGVLGLRRVSTGEYANPGQDMVNLEKIDPIKLDFRVPELFFAALAVGQSVKIDVDSFPGQNFVGQVLAIDPLIDKDGRAVLVRARIDNTDRALRPGMFARVALVLESRAAAVLVPEQALTPRGDEQFVFRILDGKAALTKVTTGQRRDALVEIVSGLTEGDMVISAGQAKIRDGAPVTNILAPSPAADSPAAADPPAAKPAS